MKLNSVLVFLVLERARQTFHHAIWLEPPSRASIGIYKRHCNLPKVKTDSCKYKPAGVSAVTRSSADALSKDTRPLRASNWRILTTEMKKRKMSSIQTPIYLAALGAVL